jgi:FkbM family methyltransferase
MDRVSLNKHQPINMGSSWVNLVQRIAFRTRTEKVLVRLRQLLQILRPLVPEFLRQNLRRAVPGAAWYPKNDRYPIVRGNVRFLINRSDYVQWRMFYGIKDVALEQAKLFATDNSVALDVGASFGAFSLCLAGHIHKKELINCHVHAFEPNPEVFRLLQKNLELNQHLNSLVRTHNFGLAETENEGPFAYSELNTGAGRVAHQSSGLRVKVRALDEFVKHIQPARISFIKMIAGGYEPKIIHGAWQTINQYKPPIFLEVTEKWWDENHFRVDDVLAELREIGYTFRIQEGNKMVAPDPRIIAKKEQYYLLATADQREIKQ